MNTSNTLTNKIKNYNIKINSLEEEIKILSSNIKNESILNTNNEEIYAMRQNLENEKQLNIN